MPILFANGFAPIYNLIRPFFADGYTFFQSCATIAFPAIIAYYKIRESFTEVQQDQMYSQKTKGVLVTLAIIFLAKPIVEVIGNYFNK